MEAEAENLLGDRVGGAHETALGEDLEEGVEGSLGVGEVGMLIRPEEETEGDAGAGMEEAQSSKEGLGLVENGLQRVRESGGEGGATRVENARQNGVQGRAIEGGRRRGVGFAGEQEVEMAQPPSVRGEHCSPQGSW